MRTWRNFKLVIFSQRFAISLADVFHRFFYVITCLLQSFIVFLVHQLVISHLVLIFLVIQYYCMIVKIFGFGCCCIIPWV